MENFKIDYSKFSFGDRFFEGDKSSRVGYYPINGGNYVNVTTVLNVKSKPGLAAWKVKKALEEGDKDAGDKYANKAAVRGKNLHHYFEMDLSGGQKPALKTAELEYRPAWEKLKSEHDIEFIAAEKKLCHGGYKYAGQVDLIARVDGLPCVADFKTKEDGSKFVWPPYDTERFQLEAYRRAWHWMGGGWLDGVVVFRLAPKGKIDVRLWNSRTDMDEANTAWSGFVSALGLWRACHQYGEANPGPMRRKSATVKGGF